MTSADSHTDQPLAGAGKEDKAVASSQRGDPENYRLKKTRRAIRWVSAIDAWKRQVGHLKHRASFPLLRQVLATEREKTDNLILLSDISTPVLERSLLSHCMILAFVVPATLWAAYTTTKGLASGIRFDIWFNAWLLQGLPLFIFCGMKTLTSNKSRKLIFAELANRKNDSGKE